MSSRNRARRKLLVEALEVRSLLANDLSFDFGDASQFDIFLLVEGVPGPSQDKDHKGWIELDSFSWGQSNGRTLSRATGATVAEDLHFLAPISVASPTLFASFATGKHIAKAELSVRKSGEGYQDYYKVTLEDILISSFQSRSIDNETPEEELTLRFAKITESVAPQNDDGTLGTPVTTSWTVPRNASRPVGERLLDHDEPDQPGAIDAFLEIEGIVGESSDDKHKGSIEISSFSWGASQTISGSGSGAGRVGALSMQDFHFVTDISSASPDLAAAVASGKHFTSAVLKVRKSGADRADYLEYKLSDVMVTSYRQQSVNNSTPLDEFTLNFAQVAQTYSEDDPNLDPQPTPVGGQWSNAIRRATYKLGDSVLDLTSAGERSQAAFLKYDGIDGESNDKDHKGEVEVLSYSWGMSRPVRNRSSQGNAASDQLKLEDFHVVSSIDKSSPLLFTSIAKGKHIAKAVLTVRKSGEGQGDYIKYDLSDVLVSSFSQRGTEESAPLQEVALNFASALFSENSSETQDPKSERVAKFERGSGRVAVGFDIGPNILEKTKAQPKRGGMFLKFEGIDGESTNSDHKGEIEVARFQWGARRTDMTSTAARNRATPALAFDELRIHAPLDASAPALYATAARGKHIPTAVLAVQTTSSDKTTRDYLKIRLNDVMISSYQARSTNNSDPIESLTLNFTKLVESYAPEGEQGVPGTPIEATWEIGRGGTVPFERKLKLEPPESNSRGTPIYLKLVGVEGESTHKDHKGEIELLSWSFGVSSPPTSRRFGGGGGAGKVAMEELRFVEATNGATPDLARGLASGKHFPTAIITASKRVDGDQRDYIKITLSDILVSSFQIQGSQDDQPIDEVSLNFTKVQFDVVPDAGFGEKPVSTSFDNGAARSPFVPGEPLLDLTVAPPSNDGAIHIKFDGIEGESVSKFHQGELRALSFSWGMSNPSSVRTSGGGGGAGKVSFSDLHLRVDVSKASPTLLSHLLTGKPIPTAFISYSEFGQDGSPYDKLKIQLSDVLISSYRVRGDSSNRIANDLALKFRTGEFYVVSDAGATDELFARFGA